MMTVLSGVDELIGRFRGSCSKFQITPIRRQLPSDFLTPVTAYLKVSSLRPNSFLLESVEGGTNVGRYSFIGVEPYSGFATQDGEDPISVLEHEFDQFVYIQDPDLQGFTGGAVGYISFDCVKYFEPSLQKSGKLKDVLQVPESRFMLCDSVVMFDHLFNTIHLIAHLRVPPTQTDEELRGKVEEEYSEAKRTLERLHARLLDPYTPEIPQASKPVISQPNDMVSEQDYKSFVRTIRNYIVEGDVYQTVPSRRAEVETELHPFNVYRHLRAINPSPYMFYIDFDELTLVGASPEIMVKVTDGVVETRPIAGTRRRGKCESEDAALAQELLNDEKEMAEHVMLVDLGRNDLIRVCDPLSVSVDQFALVEKYSHVMHTVSHVSGKLRDDLTPFSAFRSTFPAGTLSGSPKIRAIELIQKLEGTKRGPYGGAVGSFHYNGDVNTCIAIRTMVFKDGKVYLQAGGGIVYDSKEEEEYIETVNKLKGSFAALEAAHHSPFGKIPSVANGVATTAGGDTKLPDSVTKRSRAEQNANLPDHSVPGILKTINQAALTKKEPVTVLIDNYDSFTFNVYQQLCEIGANVVVFRNDDVTIEQLERLPVRNFVISPGPGTPSQAKISNSVIRHFSGKKPIFGVCLGMQCIYEIFGGKVSYAGEVVHGKTGLVKHDGKGCYSGVAQHVPMNRYHSLAGVRNTLPDELEITSELANGLVMGVRHKTFNIEGVQYHPESVISEQGKTLLRNFLALKSGMRTEREKENDRALRDGVPLGVPGVQPGETILEAIVRRTRSDLDVTCREPGWTVADYQKSLGCGAGVTGFRPPVSLYDALVSSKGLSVMCEIKRASPTRGNIDLAGNSAERALGYARAGASVISCLTEPHWFKGSLKDLEAARRAVEYLGRERPVILRKDFVIDEVQVYQARYHGADSVLLIMAILAEGQARRLLERSRSLGMEPLVEVSNEAEMMGAIRIGSRVIGVNNRDLHTFEVDMTKTTRLAALVPPSSSVVVCALSGVKGYDDVKEYIKDGRVKGVLVGEHVMKCPDPGAFLDALRGKSCSGSGSGGTTTTTCTTTTTTATRGTEQTRPLIKICGISTLEAARVAAEAGVDYVGFVFVKASRRYITPASAKAIIQQLKQDPQPYPCRFVGVFRDMPVLEVMATALESGVDIVQLHGHETYEDYRAYIPLDIIRAGPTDMPEMQPWIQHGRRTEETSPKRVSSITILYDNPVPGSGQCFDWSDLRYTTTTAGDFGLAGGLSIHNVREAISAVDPVLVDVSSGVEDGVTGVKDVTLMREFVRVVRGQGE